MAALSTTFTVNAFADAVETSRAEPSLNRSVAAADNASTISYFQEVPCATASVPHLAAVRRKPRLIRHPRPLARHVPIVKPVHVAQPVVHPVHHKPKPVHHHKLAAKKTPVVPARCEILHRDRLFGGPAVGADAVSLVPADVAVDNQVPGAGDGASPAASAGFYPTGGGGDSGGVTGVGGGGFGSGAGGGVGPGGGGIVSPAPEPQTWTLMISGLLTAGLALRLHRRRRRVSTPT